MDAPAAASKFAEAGRFDEAESMYKLAIGEAVRTRKNLEGLPAWLHALSYVEMRLGKLKEAEKAALDARSLLVKEAKPQPYLMALNLNMLGRINDFSKNNKKARAYYFSQIELIDRELPIEKEKASLSNEYVQLIQLEEQRKETLFNVSESFRMEGDLAQSTVWSKKAAEAGLPAAQFTYGLRLFQGRGTPKDLPEAANWVRQAATALRPIAGAQNLLGLMYSQGFGVRQSDVDAVRWYKKAAELGDSNARLNLVKKIMAGKGSAIDPVAAYYWLRRIRADEDRLDDDFTSEIKEIESSLTSKMSKEQIEEVEDLLRFDPKIQMMGVGGKLITF